MVAPQSGGQFVTTNHSWPKTTVGEANVIPLCQPVPWRLSSLVGFAADAAAVSVLWLFVGV